MPLRALAEADLDTIRRLRNANRKYFFYDAEITPEQQAAWFKALPANPIHFYVIEEAAGVVGTISTNAWPDGIEIGNLLLDPAARGKGLMRAAVRELTAAPGHYFAKVKSGNTPSLAVFTDTGFTVESSGEVVRLIKDVR